MGKMSTTFSKIIDWVKLQDYWEQAAFDLILSNKPIGETEIDLLTNYLLEEKGLNPSSLARKVLKFKDLASSQSWEQAYSIERIYELQNINALVENQSLEFSPDLTVIYGDNGSGKSGYARVLGCIGFTRGDREILPDIGKPYEPDSPQTVTVVSLYDGKSISTKHDINEATSKIPYIYVFDSTSVSAHIIDENTITFSPAGLQYLHSLAEVTDRVRGALENKLDRMIQPNPVVQLIVGDSEIKRTVEGLSGATNFEEVKPTLLISQQEENELKDTKQKLATIEYEGIAKKVHELKQQKTDLEKLAEDLKKVENAFGETAIALINKATAEVENNLSLANELGLSIFDNGKIRSVGSLDWHSFIHSAYHFSSEQAHPYPVAGGFCILCQQPLTTEAAELVGKIWNYLKSEIQGKIETSSKDLANRKSKIMDLNLSFFNESSAVYRLLNETNKGIQNSITKHIEEIKARHAQLEKDLAENKSLVFKEVNDGPRNSVVLLITKMVGEISDWQNQESQQGNLSRKLVNLEHKTIISKNINALEKYVRSMNWQWQARNIRTSTTHITKQYNKLFDELVTQEYLQLFQETLTRLGRLLSVKIETRASKGQVYKQLVVASDPTVPPKLTRPDKVLSEGEKRAVAFADFLTEVTLDSTCQTIVLDDPVTSLDIHWRGQVANLLAEEAADLQVIVFTHDLPFLYLLSSSAESLNVSMQTHLIEKGQVDKRPGYVHNNNGPASEREYRKPTKAVDYYTMAKDSSGEEQAQYLRLGFAAIRTSYEALIVFDIFNEVIVRFESRIRYSNLAKVVVDYELFQAIISRFEFCSRYIEGHLHPDTSPDEPISLELLLSEIQQFNSIKQKIRDLKNSLDD